MVRVSVLDMDCCYATEGGGDCRCGVKIEALGTFLRGESMQLGPPSFASNANRDESSLKPDDTGPWVQVLPVSMSKEGAVE
jgi:hypothetical protein